MTLHVSEKGTRDAMRSIAGVAGTVLALVLTLSGGALVGQTGSASTSTGPFDTLHFRSIGPASMSGRIADFAVSEANPATFWVASAHGGLWKTTNAGATF